MGKIALLLAGQGAQYPGMGKDLYESSPAAKKVFDMGEMIRPGTLEMCFESDKDTLSLTENTQPCLFLCDLACARAVEEAGISFDMAAGFSLGEIAALAFTGVLSDEDAFRLVCLRAETMSKCAAANPGSMCAVLKLSAEVVEKIASEFNAVYPVNYNCPGQIAVAGAADEMDAFMEAVKTAGGRAMKLAVSGAFHTPFMNDATASLRTFMSEISVSAPKMPLYSNYTGTVYPENTAEICDTVALQASNSVKWETILRGMAEAGANVFVEAGAGKTLSGFVGRTLTEVVSLNVGDTVSLENTVSAIKEIKNA